MTIRTIYKSALALALIFTAVAASTPSAPTSVKAGLAGNECSLVEEVYRDLSCLATGIDGGAGGGGFAGRLCGGMCMLSIRI
jgi:hypothetical protein